jgi:hypothetical protein
LQTEQEIEVPILMEESNASMKIIPKKILFPDKLILNGDIFELWDTSDQSIQFASDSNESSALSSNQLFEYKMTM